ncbi:putative colanic acid biosynthesis acetyltransferase [Winogradskyella ludwigii]|uniref:putative colanic acid biosynthesis acetyltransferase n=1 Tax=Winogradskyella ludwigii TaxID=2686076 RepID=UPI0015CE89D8|nr:putative colanic acid biosynthesis acetyltransferase [Winogradskyella ludwigii]
MKLSLKNKLLRIFWNIIWQCFFRPFSTKLFNPWRLFLLRLFGAKVHRKSGVYASCKVWAPWNLELEENAWLGPHVNVYNVALIRLGINATVSQYTYLCSASHDIYSYEHTLIAKPIIIQRQAWVGASAFIGMGVTIGKGAVVGATASVYKNVEPWTIVGGNPAKFIKERKLNG